MSPSVCKYCNLCVDHDHWYWQIAAKTNDGGYWKCKQQNRDNVRRWQHNNKDRMRLRSHHDHDKKHGLICSIDLGLYRTLVAQSCLYCGLMPSDGLDRKDCTIGHTEDNCVPCCAKCNIILGDIPFEAKVELQDGLTRLREKDLLHHWEVPSRRRIHV